MVMMSIHQPQPPQTVQPRPQARQAAQPHQIQPLQAAPAEAKVKAAKVNSLRDPQSHSSQ